MCVLCVRAARCVVCACVFGVWYVVCCVNVVCGVLCVMCCARGVFVVYEWCLSVVCMWHVPLLYLWQLIENAVAM